MMQGLWLLPVHLAQFLRKQDTAPNSSFLEPAHLGLCWNLASEHLQCPSCRTVTFWITATRCTNGGSLSDTMKNFIRHFYFPSPFLTLLVCLKCFETDPSVLFKLIEKCERSLMFPCLHCDNNISLTIINTSPFDCNRADGWKRHV